MNMEFQDQENIYELIIKCLSGRSSSEEDARLLSWKNESEANKRIFNDYRNVWIMSSQLQSETSVNTKEALARLHANIESSDVAYKPVIQIRGLVRIAAALILAFLIGGASSVILFRKPAVTTKAICRFEAPKGSRAITYLPDGTKVWLNAGSALEYSTDFNTKKREVKLSGEAFFKVKTNRSKPFIVMADNIAVKAYGTSFNVKAYPEEKEVTTTLVEGKVEIEGKEKNNKTFTYEMVPKQRVVYYKSEKQVASPDQKEQKEIKSEPQKIAAIPSKTVPIISDANVKTELYTSWKDSLWIIQSEKLEDLALLLERRYNVNITFTSEEVKKYRFSGTIQRETLEQIFEIIRFTMPVSYSINKGQVSIMLDQSLQKRYKPAFHPQN